MPTAIQRFILCVSLSVAGLACAETTSTVATGSAATTASKPNIIFIMADDLGQEALACYGNDINRTPNLDQMAAGGMKFTHGHSTPLCSPSRVQVMTGKYNNRNYQVFGIIDKDEKTFADYLKEAGYTTGVTGKWQLFGSKQQRKRAGGKAGSRPEELGFDQYCLWQVETLGSRYKNPTITTTTGTATMAGGYGPDVFSDFAVDFVRENRARPFFLYYSMVHTHAPYQPTPDSPDYQNELEKGDSNPDYFQSDIEYMDKKVGRLLDELKALGLAENTLVIFTGDNGTDKPITSTVNGQKIRGGKGTTTKYGTNVPLIASWAGKIQPGQINDNLVDFTDMLPTFLEVAGQKIPGGVGLDGISFYRQLLGEKATPREWVFCWYHPQIRNDFKAIWAHDRTWKLYSDGVFFNMTTDPLEQNPVKEADMTADARKVREILRKAIDDKMAGHVADKGVSNKKEPEQTQP